MVIYRIWFVGKQIDAQPSLSKNTQPLFRSCQLLVPIQFELQNIMIGDQNETFLVIFKYCGVE